MDLKGFKNYLEDIIKDGDLKAGDQLVVGCSTSEILGEHIGTAGNTHVATELFSLLLEVTKPLQIGLVIQCCEHLNRALVLERSTQLANLIEVSVIPQPHAGGSLATVAWQNFSDPVVVEYVSAKAGIDIGDTEIGMHVKHVQVPYRHSFCLLGEARVTGLISRPKLIGGKRAVYS